MDHRILRNPVITVEKLAKSMTSGNRWMCRTTMLICWAVCTLVGWCAPEGLLGQSADILKRMGLASKATVEREIMVPMRDGIRLSTAVISPTQVTARVPAILIRTPYDKDGEIVEHKMLSSMVSQGYALVVQNERGTGWSEGKHQFLAGARNDGYDTISWIARQPWSNGKVGTIGCSSSAEHQLGLAAMNHPAHKAMIAMSAGAGIGDIPGVSSQGAFYKGGSHPLESGQIGTQKTGSSTSPSCRRTFPRKSGCGWLTSLNCERDSSEESSSPSRSQSSQARISCVGTASQKTILIP